MKSLHLKKVLRRGFERFLKATSLTCALILLSGCGTEDTSSLALPEQNLTLYHGFDSRHITLNGARFHLIEKGQGDTIIFLHGFPYFAGSWIPLMEALAEQFHVVALEQRGYGYSEKFPEADEYQLARLVEDVRALITMRSNDSKITLIGHDWGGVVAWGLAQQYPMLVDKIIVINAPPFNAFLNSLKNSHEQRHASRYVQKLDSWYVKMAFFFKGADLLWSDSLESSLQEGRLSEDFQQAYHAAWSQPGVADGAVNWYKANIPKFDEISLEHHWPAVEARVSIPSLLIWSERDKAFTPDTLDEIKQMVDEMQLVLLDTESHTPHFDDLDNVVSEIARFLQD